MTPPRPFRFGVQLSAPLPGRTWADTARHVEDLGYSTLFVPDHFSEQLAPMTALAVAAGATTSLNVGALVFDNDYRHPVVLAKEVATLDALSDGRVEFGLGAGWMRSDYEEAGLVYDPPGVRVDRFEEALAVVRGLWSDEPVDFAGAHYTISGLRGSPSPHTPGGPKVLIGGGGRRMLTLAARHADIVGINPVVHAGAIGPEVMAEATEEAFAAKVDILRGAAGERFGELELNVLVFFASLTPDAAGMAEMMASGFGAGEGAAGAETVLASPYVLLGDEERICDVLVERRERFGVSYVVLQGAAAEELAPVVARLADA